MRFISLIFLTVLLNAAVNLNFQNLDIKDFIKLVAKISNKNILITQNIRGKINFISVKPIKESEVYDILLNILRSKGYTIIEDKGFLKVVRSIDAIKDAPGFKHTIPQFTTTIIHLNNISVRDAYSQISYLKSRYGKIVLNTKKNLFIITDYPKNIKTIKDILKRIDTLNEPSTAFLEFKYASAKKLFNKIVNILKTMYDIKVHNYQILLNDDTNSIIVVGPKRIIKTAKKLAKKFDIPPKPSDNITKIITLKNSDVNSMIKVLNSIVKIKYRKNPPSITADKETNSIIIIATPAQIETIKTIISALDIPKQQVYVKARILEISNSKASQIGNKLGIIGGMANSSGLYTLSANLGGPAIAFNPSSLGLQIPTITQGLALGATLDLLETLGAAKKLSEPSILCINNTPSTIYVGKTVSVLTGKTTSNQTSQSYSRQDIGLTLKVKPRIDSDNKVALNIDGVIEDILPGSPIDMPITSKRHINTTTIVNNGQSIIIGGLVKDNKDITMKKVPLLGDIPILGAIFRHKQINYDKTTLVIVLTPYIVKKSNDLDKLRETLAKLNRLEKEFANKLKEKINAKNK